MIKIGLIDFFIDNWHANHLPGWVRAAERAREVELSLAWEKSARGTPLDQWCMRNRMKPASSIDQVVEECDALVVLAPNNPETHLELCNLPLRSGKPVYVDKTFAPDLDVALELVNIAGEFETPFFSSSALRYDPGLAGALAQMPRGVRVEYIRTHGGGSLENYLVHQLEVVVAATHGGVSDVRYEATEHVHAIQLRFADGRLADVTLAPQAPFGTFIVRSDGITLALPVMDDFFVPLVDSMLGFFLSGQAPVPTQETLTIAAIIDAVGEARRRPGSWTPLRPIR